MSKGDLHWFFDFSSEENGASQDGQSQIFMLQCGPSGIIPDLPEAAVPGDYFVDTLLGIIWAVDDEGNADQFQWVIAKQPWQAQFDITTESGRAELFSFVMAQRAARKDTGVSNRLT